MAAQGLAAALQRVQAVLRRRPETGLHDDAPATARWLGDTRVVARHANGTELATDMPCELGGSGDRVSPGWLFRAGVAACTTTAIAMSAAAKDIELESLEVRVGSRSDTRGLLGLAGVDGEPVYAGPHEVQALVRISAHGVAPQRLRELVDDGCRRSPMARALQDTVAVAWRVEVNED